MDEILTTASAEGVGFVMALAEAGSSLRCSDSSVYISLKPAVDKKSRCDWCWPVGGKPYSSWLRNCWKKRTRSIRYVPSEKYWGLCIPRVLLTWVIRLKGWWLSKSSSSLIVSKVPLNEVVSISELCFQGLSPESRGCELLGHMIFSLIKIRGD